MLKHIPENHIARTVKQVWDITEDDPIPRGARVHVGDFVTCDDMFVIEYGDRIYLAAPDELRL